MYRYERNHINGYHGSDKDQCIWCGEPNANESKECPVKTAKVDKEQAEEAEFQKSVKKLRKSLCKANREILDELICRASDY